MKKIFLFSIVSVFLLFACSREKVNKDVPKGTTLYYYSMPTEGSQTIYLLLKEGARAELYRLNDTLMSDLTDDEMKQVASYLKEIPKWDTAYESSAIADYESVRKISGNADHEIRRTFGSQAPAPVDNLLKLCRSITERLRHEADRKNKPV